MAYAARFLTSRSTSRAPSVWFALRMFPSISALSFVLTFFVPSYWRYEPRTTEEGFDALLIVMAALAVAAFAAAALRGASGLHSAARRTREWMRTARPLQLAGSNVPAFEVDADEPILALAGVMRPRMLVTRGLISALTPDELSACVAHELGHAHAWDNLTRLVMRAAPDVLPRTRLTSTLERGWAASAECRADHAASHRDPSARCALASALVKVARLTSSTPPVTEPVSTLVSGGDIAARVRRLLDDRTAASPGRTRRVALGSTALAAAVAIGAGYDPLLRAVHEATEILVRVLF